MKTDSDPAVRRGAISVTKHLFKGLGTNIDKVKCLLLFLIFKISVLGSSRRLSVESLPYVKGL